MLLKARAGIARRVVVAIASRIVCARRRLAMVGDELGHDLLRVTEAVRVGIAAACGGELRRVTHSHPSIVAIVVVRHRNRSAVLGNGRAASSYRGIPRCAGNRQISGFAAGEIRFLVTSRREGKPIRTAALPHNGSVARYRRNIPRIVAGIAGAPRLICAHARQPYAVTEAFDDRAADHIPRGQHARLENHNVLRRLRRSVVVNPLRRDAEVLFVRRVVEDVIARADALDVHHHIRPAGECFAALRDMGGDGDRRLAARHALHQRVDVAGRKGGVEGRTGRVG